MTNWPGDNAVFPLCVALVKQFEGFRAAPYLDSVGIATIGYGSTTYPGGEKIGLHDPAITQDQGVQFLDYSLGLMRQTIAPLFSRMPTRHQAAAMLCLTYNIGPGAFRGSTVLARFNAGDIAGAADAFLAFDKGHVNGQLVTIAGLHNRRVAERAVFLTHD